VAAVGGSFTGQYLERYLARAHATGCAKPKPPAPRTSRRSPSQRKRA